MFLKSNSSTSIIHSPIQLEGPENIEIGDYVRIQPFAWISAKVLCEEMLPKLRIGDGTSIGRFFHLVVSNEIIIGDHCLINERVYISDTTHEYNNLDVTITKSKIQNIGKVIIGKSVWIGEGAMIFGNIVIGDHAVIAAGSIVKHNVEARTVVAGAPAKVITIIK